MRALRTGLFAAFSGLRPIFRFCRIFPVSPDFLGMGGGSRRNATQDT
jgi:hypothetical protein